MPDYGHEIEFGYFLSPDAGDPEGVLEAQTIIDRAAGEAGRDLEDVAPQVRERVAAARAR